MYLNFDKGSKIPRALVVYSLIYVSYCDFVIDRVLFPILI